MNKKCTKCSIIKDITEYYKKGKYFASECKICAKARVRARYDIKKEEIKEYHKEYRKTHDFDSWSYKCSRDPNYKEKYNARQKKWREKNPETFKEQKRRGNLRRRANCPDLSEDTKQLIKDSYDNICTYCGIEGKMEIDHIHPVSKGGTNGISNLTLACRSCNASKNDKIIYG